MSPVTPEEEPLLPPLDFEPGAPEEADDIVAEAFYAPRRKEDQ